LLSQHFLSDSHRFDGAHYADIDECRQLIFVKKSYFSLFCLFAKQVDFILDKQPRFLVTRYFYCLSCSLLWRLNRGNRVLLKRYYFL